MKETFQIKGWTVGCISDCKRNMLQVEGIISDARWKGFDGAQLNEKVERREIQYFKNIFKSHRRDALAILCSLCCDEQWRRELFCSCSHAYLLISLMASEDRNNYVQTNSLMALPHLRYPDSTFLSLIKYDVKGNN